MKFLLVLTHVTLFDLELRTSGTEKALISLTMNSLRKIYRIELSVYEYCM